MDKNTIVALLNKLGNGSFFTLNYKGDMTAKLNKTAKADGIVSLTKIVSVTARKGIDYDKQRDVMEKVANGKVLTHKLPWGVWSTDPAEKDLIIYHKGNSYLRTYFCSVPQSEYFANGKPISTALAKQYLQASAFHGHDDAYSINTENIISMVSKAF